MRKNFVMTDERKKIIGNIIFLAKTIIICIGIYKLSCIIIKSENWSEWLFITGMLGLVILAVIAIAVILYECIKPFQDWIRKLK